MRPEVAIAAALSCLLAVADAEAQSDSLIIESPSARAVLTAADLAALPHDTATFSAPGHAAERFSGVPLHLLLRRVGVRADSIRGRAAVGRRVVVEAADGYRVVLSLAELDPALPDRRVLLADRLSDGEPLAADARPYRLVVAGDPHHARWARRVIAIRVRDEP